MYMLLFKLRVLKLIFWINTCEKATWVALFKFKQVQEFLVITMNAHCLLDENNGQYM